MASPRLEKSELAILLRWKFCLSELAISASWTCSFSLALEVFLWKVLLTLKVRFSLPRKSGEARGREIFWVSK